jgi:hypothetical protein
MMRAVERPDDFTLFAQYHLGILPDGKAQFQNMGDLARRYGVSIDEVEAWLMEHQIDATTADDTDYDLAQARALVRRRRPDAVRPRPNFGCST